MSADPPTAAADVRAYLHRPEDSLRTAFAHLLSLSTAQLALDTARFAAEKGSIAVSSGSCVHRCWLHGFGSSLMLRCILVVQGLDGGGGGPGTGRGAGEGHGTSSYPN
jgi:hypothetical protein